MYAVSPRLFILVFVFTLAPLTFLFAGNFPLAQITLPILCAILLLVCRPASLSLPASTSARWLLAGITVPLGLALLGIMLQLVPLSPNSTLVNPFWSLIPNPTWVSASLNPGTTLSYLTMAMGYIAVSYALFRVGQTNPRPILVTVATIITITSVYGIIAYALGNTHVLWLPKTIYEDSLTATFINRNSFATFAGLGVLANLALAMERIGEISSRLNFRQRLQAFMLLVLRPGWPFMLAAVLCFLALMLTNSRAGLLASVVGLIVFLAGLATVRAPARLPLLALLGLIGTTALILLVTVGGTLASRLSLVAFDANLRQSIYTHTGTLIAQSPLTGSGFGTYPQALGTVADAPFLKLFPNPIDHAHNTYLELLSELGYPLSLLLAFSATCLLIACLNGMLIRRRAVMWPTLGVATIALVGGHALADFSLSVPAVLLATLSLLLPALAQSFPLNNSTKSNATSLTSHSGVFTSLAPVLATLIIVLAAWQASAATFAYRSASIIRQLHEVQPVPHDQILIAQKNLTTCLKINPYNNLCAMGLAQTNLSLATSYGFEGPKAAVALVFLNLAEQQYLSALTLSPANPLAWYRLARISAFQKDNEKAVTYLANSLLTGPAEPKIAIQRIPLMLSLLPNADPENQALFINNIKQLWDSDHWNVGLEMRQNRSMQRRLANLLPNTPETRELWAHGLETPFPQAK